MIPAQIPLLNTHSKLGLTDIISKITWSNHSAFSSATVTWMEKHLMMELVSVMATGSVQEKYVMNKSKTLGPHRWKHPNISLFQEPANFILLKHGKQPLAVESFRLHHVLLIHSMMYHPTSNILVGKVKLSVILKCYKLSCRCQTEKLGKYYYTANKPFTELYWCKICKLFKRQKTRCSKNEKIQTFRGRGQFPLLLSFQQVHKVTDNCGADSGIVSPIRLESTRLAHT